MVRGDDRSLEALRLSERRDRSLRPARDPSAAISSRPPHLSIHSSPVLSSIAVMLAFTASRAQDAPLPEMPLTVPEASEWSRTSTHAEVLAFLEELRELPSAERLVVETVGGTQEKRELVLVTAKLPRDPESPPPLRIFVNANIHAGEVEGKEAVQMLLREIASGEHEALLRGADLMFLPVYNADGNDRIDKKNRTSQNGPDGGVGERANAQGLDLNRDFVKAESPECRTLLRLFRMHDPHLFMDLHTTNGSHHGYQLTYSPSLSTNIDAELDAFARGTLLPEVRAAVLEEHGYRTFDYGNFSRGEQRRWSTYDHRPRFGTNYYGLRNRLSVLSEAYSYADYETRVRATRAFVLEVITTAVKHADRIRAVCDAADARVLEGADIQHGFDSELVEGSQAEVLVGSVETVELPDDLGRRSVALPEFTSETMLVQDAFHSKQQIALPWAWAIPAPSYVELDLLLAHGVHIRRLRTSAMVAAYEFAPEKIHKGSRLFQGHHEVTLRGEWRATERELPTGTLIVSARQSLGRVAAQLLEAQSEDSLSTWNMFESRTRAGEDPTYPVLRLSTPHELDTEPVGQR